MSGRVGAGSRRWTCLIFHDVLPATTASGGGPERFAVSVEGFERALDTIRGNGFRGCSVADCIALGASEPVVGITFDDGARNNFDHAVPALRARGMTATFYVTTDWVGTEGFMTWDQLRQLVAWGMSVQSHTRSHQLLSELDEDAVRAQLVDSKTVLDEQLGQDTIELGLPGGDFPKPAYRHLFDDAGYRIVANSRWGTNSASDGGRPRGVRRCTVRGHVTEDFIRRTITVEPRLFLRRVAVETARSRLRSTLGANRYSRIRRRFLDLIAGTRAS